VSGDQHQKIKALASWQGKSIKGYVPEKILSDGESTWKALNISLSDRINTTENNPPMRWSLEDLTLNILKSEKP